MKKVLALFLVAVMALGIFAGCGNIENNPPKNEDIDAENTGNDVTVTEQNVSELFKPSLEAYVFLSGSAFYDVEKDADGKIVDYIGTDIEKLFDCPLTACFKITGGLTAEEIKSKVASYTYEPLYPEHLDRYFAEKDGSLYVGVGDFKYGNTLFDENSIRLLKSEGGKYYITVDKYYAYQNGKDDYTVVGGTNPWVFTTAYKDGKLYIESVDENGDAKEPENGEEARNYIYDVFKFSDYFTAREEEMPISKTGMKTEKLASASDIKTPVSFKAGNSTVTLKINVTDIDYTELYPEKVYRFRDGKISLSTEDGYITVDKTGKKVGGEYNYGVSAEEVKFGVGQVGDGLYILQTGRPGAYKQKLCNDKKEPISELEFDSIGHFYDGIAAVTDGHKVGFIDEKGNVLLEPTVEYDKITALPKGNEPTFIEYIYDGAFILPIGGKVAIVTIEKA